MASLKAVKRKLVNKADSLQIICLTTVIRCNSPHNSISERKAVNYLTLKANNSMKNPHPRIILASSSESRKMLLTRLLNEFECISPDIDETPLANENYIDLALRLSQQKSLAVQATTPDAIIIAGDQTAECQDQQLHKPLTEDKAVEQLLFCSGKTVTFNSGLCVSLYEQHLLSCTSFTVKFRELTFTEIENYLRRDQPLWSAGSFKAESLGISLFETMNGNDFTALIGLPLIQLNKDLTKLGINPLLI